MTVEAKKGKGPRAVRSLVPKICAQCGAPFYQKESDAKWAKRILCGLICVSSKGGSTPKSPDHIEKVAAASRGRKHTPKSRQQMSETRKRLGLSFVSDAHRAAFLEGRRAPASRAKARKTRQENKRKKWEAIIAAGEMPCSRCQIVKSLNEFGSELRFFAGKSGVCLACENADSRARYKAAIPSWRLSVRERINKRIGNLLRAQLRAVGLGKNKKTKELVGYDGLQLKEHLERQFTKGMSWEKFMRGEIHIDHIVPKLLFHFDDVTDPEFKACWALANLRPLWKADNLKKHTMREVLL